MAVLLLIEDDPEIRQAYRLAMTRREHSVRTAATGHDGVAAADSDDIDAIILDAMLPDIDGFEVCRRIRQTRMTPIIMLTARDSDSDIVGGLESGADDYVIKPVEPAVLDARIRAVMRRASMLPLGLGGAHRWESGDLTIDSEAMTVTRAGEPIALSPTELRLLLELVEHSGQVLSRDRLLERVWDIHHPVESRLVDAAIQRLRARVELDPSRPAHLHTVRGFGYRWD